MTSRMRRSGCGCSRRCSARSPGTRGLAKRLPTTPQSELAGAIGGRLLRRFGLRSARLFGKAIPGLGAVLGALADRSQLNKIAAAAKKSFPPVA